MRSFPLNHIWHKALLNSLLTPFSPPDTKTLVYPWGMILPFFPSPIHITYYTTTISLRKPLQFILSAIVSALVIWTLGKPPLSWRRANLKWGREECGDSGCSFRNCHWAGVPNFGLWHACRSRATTFLALLPGTKSSSRSFEDYASLRFVGDHIADLVSHMEIPQRDAALVLL